MQTPHPLRHIGPKLFISYSFSDRDAAERIERFLVSRGLQVRKEDETSLLGQNLSHALPQRIGDAEVFLQLLTSTSAASNWVQREFDWAVGRKKATGNPLVIPVVLGDAKPEGAINEWVYIVAKEGLTEEVLAMIERGCMNAVEPLPFDETRIFQFNQERVAHLLRLDWQGHRRIIVDSDGFLNTLADDAIRFAQQIKGEHRGDMFGAQEERRRDRINRLLTHADRALPKLLQELHDHFQHYASDFPARAVEAVNRFSRLLLGTEMIKIRQFFHQHLPLLQSFEAQFQEAKAVIDEGQKRQPGEADYGERHWALGKRPSDGCSQWVEVGLDGVEGKRSVSILLPVTAIGSDWQLVLQIGERPDALLEPYDWADFGLPQIAQQATYAMNSTASPAEIIAEYGWKLSDYRRMGSP